MTRTVAMFLMAWFGAGHPAQMQTPAPSPLAVQFLILEATGQTMPGLGLELLVFEYGASTELWWAGSCVTDAQGTCLITATLPPSVAPDWYEGVVYVETLGRQRVAWQGTEALLTIQLAPDGNLPTEEPFLHPPYETQPDSPTDTPLNWFPTATDTPLSPIPPATASLAPSSTPLPTLTLTALPFLDPASPERASGGLWRWLLGGLLLLLGGLFVWRTYAKK